MAKLNVNPTRMELSRLKARLATSTRGHKLLKDKQDELMRQFIAMIKENKRLRESVEAKLTDSFEDFLLARSMNSSQMLDEALAISKESIQLDIQTKNLMSVNVPVMTFLGVTKRTHQPYTHMVSVERHQNLMKLSRNCMTYFQTC